MVTLPKNSGKGPEALGVNGGVHIWYFAELLKRPVCAGSIRDRIGTLADLVLAQAEPYPQVIGIYIEHGWGKPTEFVPWDKVVKIEDDAIFVQKPEGGSYPPFVDQPGWIMVDNHLMGRTILDTDGRRIEVVNDVRLLELRGRLVLTDVDISFNGFLRRWGLGRLRWISDNFISWKYVQPLSLEDAIPTDRVSLSVTRKQLRELPGEDLADALEELSGKEQQALFAALDPEKAAETLIEAEPRALRQIMARLPKEQAQAIFAEMTVPQLANLFGALARQEMMAFLDFLPADRAEGVRTLLSDREATARELISSDFITKPREAKVGDVLAEIRRARYEPRSLSYIYVVEGTDDVLVGIVDLRDLVLSPDEAVLGDIMVAPVVAANSTDLREDLTKLFEKYEFRMIPVVDEQDHMYGVISYKDVMKGPDART
ncbi:MAG: CBS domain-containing protein [Acidobacteria bacterium]|nr:CBS domain-containing protein [Acidobacteriota bacterium]